MNVSRRKLVYWLCLTVYLIGVVSYLTGLGAFSQQTTGEQVTVETHGKETVVSPEYPQFAEQSQPTIVDMFTVIQWGEILLGFGAMITSILVTRELETNPTFLATAQY